MRIVMWAVLFRLKGEKLKSIVKLNISQFIRALFRIQFIRPVYLLHDIFIVCPCPSKKTLKIYLFTYIYGKAFYLANIHLPRIVSITMIDYMGFYEQNKTFAFRTARFECFIVSDFKTRKPIFEQFCYLFTCCI